MRRCCSPPWWPRPPGCRRGCAASRRGASPPTPFHARADTPPPPKPPANPEARSSLFVGSTEKAFQVLEAFNGQPRHMSMAEIARNAELDRSATQRLVYTLEKLGYLRRIPDSLRYGLSSKVLRLSY